MHHLSHCAGSVLRARGLISATTTTTEAQLSQFFQRVKSNPTPIACYVGFDPTADSLHIGNLVSLRVLQILQHHGFRPIALVGGATGLIGDPSGRSTERNMQSTEQIQRNAQGIEANVRYLLRPDTRTPANHATVKLHSPTIVNNLDWYLQQTPLDFIRDVGRHFRMGSMLSRDSVKSRLDSDSGMSFTEFSYQLFQAYDYLHLYRHHNCLLQIGGSDQWGNIVGGCELVRRSDTQRAEPGTTTPAQAHEHQAQESEQPDQHQQVHGLTVPLLTTSTGEKLGKSAGNAIWVDANKTSPYELYQYFLNIADTDVEQCYSMLALDPALDAAAALDQINETMDRHREAPAQRYAQRCLADSMVGWIHGDDGLASAQQATQALFGGVRGGGSGGGGGGGGTENGDAVDWRLALKDAPSCTVGIDQVVGASIVMFVTEELGLFKSRGEARRMIKSGGLYMNQERLDDGDAVLELKDVLNGDLVVFRKGKRNYMLVDVEREGRVGTGH